MEAMAVAAAERQALAGTVRPGIGAHPPGRAVPGNAVLLIGFNVGIAHARKVVVGGVERANMVEAEEVILTLPAAPFGRTVQACCRAAPPLADGCLFPRCPLVVGLDADAVEVFGVELHCCLVCAQAVAGTR